MNGTIVRELDCRIESVIKEFQSSPIGRLAMDKAASTDLIMATIREVYWEIHCYQPYTTKAGFAMIGAIGPEDRRIMKTLLLHKWEEVEHRVWALEGFIALGGNKSRIGREAELTSPGAFAVSAVWEKMATQFTPLAYLGAEYLFEDLTARLTKLVANSIADRGLSREGMRFIVDHATEDERHSNLLKKLLDEIEQSRPTLGHQILHAFDCFHQVYPMPLWLGSFQRARECVDKPELLPSERR